MKKAINFDMVLTLDGESIRAVVRVGAYYPAVMHLAEGGEIEEYQFFGADGKEIVDADGKILDSLEADIFEKLDSADDGPDPDMAYDMMKAGD